MVYDIIKTYGDYKEIYTLMQKFYELPILEKRIIDYLMNVDVFEGGYSKFTMLLGLSKGEESNVRKALLNLDDLGIICVCKKYYEEGNSRNPMKACYLIDGWLETLLNTDNNRLKTRKKVKRKIIIMVSELSE